MNDLKFAFRQLRRNRGFTAIVVFTLALGIGANTALFSVLNTTFLRALPYPAPDRLVFLSERSGTFDDTSVSYPNFLDWQEQQDVFSALTLFNVEGGKLKTAESAEQVSVGLVTADFFNALGVTVAQGRALTGEDDRAGAAPVAWLTHRTWQKHFAGDPGLVGRGISLEGESVTVAGILPAGFRFLREVDVYRPLTPLAESRFMNMRQNHKGAYAIGRLREGVTLTTARTQMDGIAQRLEREYPKSNTGLGINLSSLRERISGSARTQLLLLLGAVGMVLLIACVNVAHMLLARSLAREKEMAMRTALGASRLQLMRQLLIESLLLAALGGMAGALLGGWVCPLLGRLVPWEVQAVAGQGLGLDPRVLGFVAGVTLLTGIGFGLAPAWQLSHTNPQDALKHTRRARLSVFGRFRLSEALVGVQVALALVLLISAGLLLRSLQHLLRVNPGFEPERLLSLRVTAPPIGSFPTDPFASSIYHERVLEAVRRLPEVEAAAFGTSVPFTWDVSTWAFYRDGRPVPAHGEFPAANSHFVTSDYFRTLGITLLRGRVFDGHETQPTIPPGSNLTWETLPDFYQDITLEGIISQRTADKYWLGEDPLGKRFRFGYPDMRLPWVQIVGVVGNTTQQGLHRGEEAEFYLAQRQLPIPMDMHLLIRTRMAPSAAAASVRAAIRSVAPDEPVFDVKPMAERVSDFSAGRRFDMCLYLFFAGVGLLLAGIGLYGVLAFNVSQRTREVGIRVALGAQRGEVLGSVVMRGLTLVVPGLGLGLVGAWAMGQVLQSQLFGVAATDGVTYLLCPFVLLLTALAACLVPARRAAQVDPVVALRCE